MKLLNWISNWFGGSTKSAGALGVGLRVALSGGAPGGWASDHREETAHNTGFNYIAIHAIASQVAGATVTVFADGEQQGFRQARRKSLASRTGSFTRWKSTYGADDRETDPLPTTHPLVRLLKRPNPFESGANFRYRQAQQIRLTGTCLIWNVPSLSGPTCERYVIPTSMASPVSPTLELPRGGWRISPVASRYSPITDCGYVDCPSWYQILGQIVDARQVQIVRLPHAWYLDDGQSPLSAGAKWVDAGEAVDEARYHQLKNGIDPSVVWNLPPDVSPDQDEMDRVQAKISAKYGGPENVGRVMVAQNGTTVTPLSTSPKEMCYSEGFQDFKAAVLALHQTPPVAVGLQEPGAYAAYNASMKAWRHSAIQPLCDILAESDTEFLAPQFGPGLTIEIESDSVDDAELIEQQLQNDLAAKVRTKNEWRAVRGMPPLPGSQGDAFVGTDEQPASNGAEGKGEASTPQSISNLLAVNGRTKSDRNSFRLPARADARFGKPPTDGDFPPQSRQFDDASSADSDTESGDTLATDNNYEADESIHRAGLIAEILYGIFGSSAVAYRDAVPLSDAKSFDPAKHPRDELGRWARIGTEQQVATLRAHVSRILAGEMVTSEVIEDVSQNLLTLPTSNLEALHREHGYVPVPQLRSHLIRSVLGRLHPLELPGADASAFRPRSNLGKVEVYVKDEDKVLQLITPQVGTNKRAKLTLQQWGDVVGAQPGARVYVYPDAPNVEVFTDHPDYRCKRSLNSSRILDVEIRIARRARKQGLATRILSQQVKTAAEFGFKSIELGAAGQGTNVPFDEDVYASGERRPGGYYAWARLGFDGNITELMDRRKNHHSQKMRDIAIDFDQRFPGTTKVSQLMQTPEGRDWWKKFGGYFEGTFNLADRSRSRQILTEYISEKTSDPQRKSLVPFAHDRATEFPSDPKEWLDQDAPGIENSDPLTAEDEAILDRIWDRINQEIVDGRGHAINGAEAGH